MHTSKDNSSKMDPNKNTCLPEWTGIPEYVQQYILEFLPPSIDLNNMITLSKNNLNLHGKYIIQRLQNEKFKCKSIQTGYYHTLVLMNDGSLYAWGRNNEGQLGLGNMDNQKTPQLISPNHFPNKIIKSIHTGDVDNPGHGHNLALMEDGSLYAWGSNGYGQLGLGHTDNQNTPRLIDPSHFPNKTIKSIHTRYDHTLAFMEDGSLYAWGYNDEGQLVLGHNEYQDTPQLIDRENFYNNSIQSIHTGGYHNLALMDDGSLYAWGCNDSGQLGLGHNNDQNTPQLISPNHFPNKTIKSIHTGYNHTLAFMEDRSLYAWGNNALGQLGLGHTDIQNTPQLIDRENFYNNSIQSVHTGWYHTLALMNDGSLYAWGDNRKRQLGLGHITNQNTPQLIDSNHFPNKKIKSIHTGAHDTLVLTKDGSLYAWGDNGEGKLGLGHNEHQNTPHLISPNHFPNKIIKSVQTGDYHTLVLMNDGSLYAWGNNFCGQLGLGNMDNQNTPQKIEGRLERAFKLGHLSMFSDKSPEKRQSLKNRFLSQHVSFNDEINGDNIQDNPLGRQA